MKRHVFVGMCLVSLTCSPLGVRCSEATSIEAVDARVDSLMSVGRWTDALKLARQELAHRSETLGDHDAATLRLLSNIGLALSESGLDAAEDTLSLALERYELIGREPCDWYAESAARLGTHYGRRFRYDEAEPVLLTAVAVGRGCTTTTPAELAVYLHYLGTFYSQIGRNLESEAAHREALSIRRRTLGPDHPSVAQSLRSLAIICIGEGRTEERREMFEEAIRIRRVNEPGGRLASTLADFGVELCSSDPVLAESLLVEAHRIRRAINPHGIEAAHSVNSLAVLRTEQGRLDEADSLFREVEVALRANGALGLVPKALLNRAKIAARLGDLHRAERLARRAGEVEDSLHGQASFTRWKLHQAQGRYAWARQDLDAAAHHFAACLERFEQERRAKASPLEAVTVLDLPYVDAACVELERGNTASAWPLVQQGTGRGLLDLIDREAIENAEPAERLRRDMLVERLARLEVASEVTSTTRSKSAAESLLIAKAEWARYEADLPRRLLGAPPVPSSINEIQATLGPEEAIIGWLDPAPTTAELFDANSWGYVIHKSGDVVWVRLPSADTEPLADPPSLPSIVDQYVQTLSHPRRRSPLRLTEAARTAEVLYRTRLEPLQIALQDATRWVIVPTGPCAGVPWDAVLTDARTSGQIDQRTISITYSPSATILAWLRQAKATERGRRGTALLVGDPIAAEERQPLAQAQSTALPIATLGAFAPQRGTGSRPAWSRRLPGSTRELDALQCLWKFPTVLRREDATEERLHHLAVEGSLSKFDVLHFASHAVVDADKFHSAYVVLSEASLDPAQTRANGYDGRVTARQILSDWRLEADLVTLSGCQTALGSPISSEGFVGFAHSLLPRGARCLLMSLWSVDDAATSLLMQYFYEEWLGHTCEDDFESSDVITEPTKVNKSAALEQAKDRLRNIRDSTGTAIYADPHYWAGFVLVGDAN